MTMDKTVVTDIRHLSMHIAKKKFSIFRNGSRFKISGTYRDYYTLLGKRLQYLHKLLQDFR